MQSSPSITIESCCLPEGQDKAVQIYCKRKRLTAEVRVRSAFQRLTDEDLNELAQNTTLVQTIPEAKLSTTVASVSEETQSFNLYFHLQVKRLAVCDLVFTLPSGSEGRITNVWPHSRSPNSTGLSALNQSLDKKCYTKEECEDLIYDSAECTATELFDPLWEQFVGRTADSCSLKQFENLLDDMQERLKPVSSKKKERLRGSAAQQLVNNKPLRKISKKQNAKKKVPTRRTRKAATAPPSPTIPCPVFAPVAIQLPIPAPAVQAPSIDVARVKQLEAELQELKALHEQLAKKSQQYKTENAALKDQLAQYRLQNEFGHIAHEQIEEIAFEEFEENDGYLVGTVLAEFLTAPESELPLFNYFADEQSMMPIDCGNEEYNFLTASSY